MNILQKRKLEFKKRVRMRLIPFKDIDEQDEFFGGAQFVKKYTGLRKIKPEDDFFEYMLINDDVSSDWMICAHIDKYKAGSVVSYVKTTTADTNRKTVTALEFKRSNILKEEIDNWFYHYVEYDRYWMQNQARLVDRLNSVDFHGIPVNKISLNFNYMILSLDFKLYNEMTGDYDSFIIKFENLEDLKTDKLILDSDTDIKITSFDYKQAEMFEGRFILLTGQSNPLIEIDFKCEEIKMMKN